MTAGFAQSFGQWVVTRIASPQGSAYGSGSVTANASDKVTVDFDVTADPWNTGKVDTNLDVRIGDSLAMVPVHATTDWAQLAPIALETQLQDIWSAAGTDSRNGAYVSNGGAIEMVFSVHNLGNQPGTMQFVVTQDPPHALVGCDPVGPIAPGQTATVYCGIHAQVGAPNEYGQTVTVQARTPTYSPSFSALVDLVQPPGTGGSGTGSGSGGGGATCHAGALGCACASGACTNGTCVNGTCFACGAYTQICCDPDGAHSQPWCTGSRTCAFSTAQNTYACVQ